MLTSKEFELKYDTYKDTVFRIAFTYLKNQAESEDVMQEVFLKLYTAAPDFEGEEHEKRWLIRVTVNLCKNQLKSFWRSHRGEIENLEQIADQPMDEVLSNRESGTGRPDLTLKTAAIRKGRVILLEVKLASGVADMERKCDEALRQIAEKRYDAPFRAEGYPKVESYGICFYKKECMVKKAIG